jgi:hypothetical protein
MNIVGLEIKTGQERTRALEILIILKTRDSLWQVRLSKTPRKRG